MLLATATEYPLMFECVTTTPEILLVGGVIDWGVGTACLLQIALGAVSMLVDTKWLFEFEHQPNQNHPHPTICTQLGAIGHNAKRDFISIGSLI